MKACGIVTEYNPFHNGHIYHIQEARKLTQCDCMIAVMSGNFVQRGEPAIIDKWSRAKACLEHGVDLVLELPYPFATQSADQFAYGAITTLALAQVSDIVFGSESNNLVQLQTICDELPMLTKSKTESFIKNFSTLYPSCSSNDLLGISYLKALKNYPMITPHTIKRTNGYHSKDMSSSIASASAIRQACLKQQDLSNTTTMANDLDQPFYLEQYYPYLQTLLMNMDTNDLKEIFLMDEGMEQLLKNNAKKYFDFTTFINACVSKRYTKSRIQRTLIQVLTQTKKTEIKQLPALHHMRVLGFNQVGRAYLSSIDLESSLLASKFNQIPEPYRILELRAAQAYAYPLSLLERKDMIAKEWQSLVYVK